GRVARGALLRRGPLCAGDSRARAPERLLELALAATTRAVGQARQGRLADVLRRAYAELRRRFLQGRPQILAEPNGGLVHSRSDIGYDSVRIGNMGSLDTVHDIAASADGHVQGDVLAEVSRTVVRLH